GEREERRSERGRERIDARLPADLRKLSGQEGEVSVDLPVVVSRNDHREGMTERLHALVARLSAQLGPRKTDPDRQVDARREDRQQRDQPERTPTWRKRRR